MNAHPPIPYSAWLADQEHGLDRSRMCGTDPHDDALEQQAAHDTARDRALDHAPVTR